MEPCTNISKWIESNAMRGHYTFTKADMTEVIVLLQGQILDHFTRNARFYLLLYFFVIGFQQDIHYCRIAMRDASLENVIALESQRFASGYDWNRDEIHIEPPQVKRINHAFEPSKSSKSSIEVRATKRNPSARGLRCGEIKCKSPPKKVFEY